MKIPPLSRELVWKLDNMHTLLDVDRLGGMARLDGNPWRVEIKRFGRATAFTSSAIPTAYYNKVVGFGAAELNFLDEIASFFVGNRAPTCLIDLLPGDLNVALADRLSAFGLRHVDFHAGYYGPAEVGDASMPAGVTIRPVESAEDLATYLEIFHKGWEMEPSTLGAFKQTMRFWHGLPGWNLYLSYIDGVPCGVGLMLVRDGIGYLAIATTLHAFRNRGCEKALMIHAIRDAKAQGCEIVCGQCEVTSPSARNFERMGMRLAYHKAMWLLRGQTAHAAPAQQGADTLY